MTRKELYRFVCNAKVLEFLDSDAQEVLDRTFRENPNRRKLSGGGVLRDLKNLYRDRVAPLYVHAVAKDILKEVQKTDPFQAANLLNADRELLTEAAEKVRESVGADAATYYRDQMILLPELEIRIRNNFHDSQSEFLDNVLKYRDDISNTLFGGKKISKIESLTGTGGDVHRNGRAVTGVHTDAGTFYYKPHDCRIDLLYQELVWSRFDDCTLAAYCVAGDGCGFISYLAAKPLADPEQLHDYYANFGKLTALFHGIGASDMHYENILPCGVRPLAVDLETIFTPKIRPMGQSGGRTAKNHQPGAEEMQYSVLRTGILPWYLLTVGVCSPLFESAQGENYLPHADGIPYTIRGYEEDYLRGFREGYQRMAEWQEDIRALFDSRGDIPIRLLLRNSVYYSHLLRRLYRKENLSSRENQKEVLNKLRIPFEANQADEVIVNYEADCLLRGDIPYYCTTLDGRALCGSSPDEILHKNYMMHSAREEVFFMLDRLSGTEEKVQEDLIRCSMAQAPLSVNEKDAVYPLPDKPVDRESLARMIRGIGEEIKNYCIHTGDGSLLWINPSASVNREKTCGYISGAADAGRFITSIPPEMEFRAIKADLADIREACIDYVGSVLIQRADEDPMILRAGYRLGSRMGLDGILAFCDEMAADGSQKAEKAYRLLIRIIKKKELIKDRSADSLAWFLTALCESSTEAPEKEELIRDCAHALHDHMPLPAHRMRRTSLRPAYRTASPGKNSLRP